MVCLKLFMDILFVIVISYFSFKFIQVLMKMKQRPIFPNSSEIGFVRKHPDKPLDSPTYSEQKVGIIIHSIVLLFVIVMFLLGAFLQLFNWSLYLLLFLPMANTSNLFNLFALVEDGLLTGSRFIPWKRIKSFQFVPIDINHRFYGYSKEANDGFELKIKTKVFTTSCIVTSAEMKEKLSEILNEHILMKENEAVLEEQR